MKVKQGLRGILTLAFFSCVRVAHASDPPPGELRRFETPRYDDEPVQQDRRAQSFQGQTSGAPNLVDFISNIFSP